jgi:hypothetical protein
MKHEKIVDYVFNSILAEYRIETLSELDNILKITEEYEAIKKATNEVREIIKKFPNYSFTIKLPVALGKCVIEINIDSDYTKYVIDFEDSFKQYKLYQRNEKLKLLFKINKIT